MAIEAKNVCKAFGEKKVLQNLNIRLEDGGIYCLMGPSGMGKTTFLRILMGLEKMDSGSITGVDYEKGLAVMFQEDRLITMLTALQNVALVYQKKAPMKAIREDMMQILPEKCLNQPVSELSGGMKRRVALCRAMHDHSEPIILDEPFTGLDTETRRQVINYILKNRRGRILLVATHGEDDARLLGAKVIRLEECQDVEPDVAKKGLEQMYRQMKTMKLQKFLDEATDSQMDQVLELVSEVMEDGGSTKQEEA